MWSYYSVEFFYKKEDGWVSKKICELKYHNYSQQEFADLYIDNESTLFKISFLFGEKFYELKDKKNNQYGEIKNRIDTLFEFLTSY